MIRLQKAQESVRIVSSDYATALQRLSLSIQLLDRRYDTITDTLAKNCPPRFLPEMQDLIAVKTT